MKRWGFDAGGGTAAPSDGVLGGDAQAVMIASTAIAKSAGQPNNLAMNCSPVHCRISVSGSCRMRPTATPTAMIKARNAQPRRLGQLAIMLFILLAMG